MDDFILRALIGAVGIAVLSGPLGCLVVWQKMSYFGAALAHAALLGVALGFYFSLDVQITILATSLLTALLLLLLSRSQQLSTDTVLGILAHSTLALGIIMLSLLPNIRIDLMAYLFGDVLSISWKDIIWIYLGGALILVGLSRIWPAIISLTMHRELALTNGINESKTRLFFLLLLSFVVAISMQVVGALLIVSLLIIPAASARKFSNSPEQMAVYATLIALVSVLIGLWASLQFDTPAGPSMVLSASMIFILSLVFSNQTSR